MQSFLGRVFYRAFASNVQTEIISKQQARDLKFVTGCSGFGKNLTPSYSAGPKKLTYGDDSYFIARTKKADVLGVADGVGGWRNYGVDPSVFSQSLMMVCERLVNNDLYKPHSPADIIQDSYQELLSQKSPLVGSSTACVVSLHKAERTIYSANLGDSGFLLIRDGEVVHRSVEQQHYFNTPFQLTVAPPGQEDNVLSDRIEMADRSSYKVEHGDILLMGTDGLFDNMHEDMILDYITRYKDHKNATRETAKNIAQKAYDLSFDPDYLSPFSMSAIDAGIEIRGGKPDDITVIVASVSYDGEAT